jgi:DNA-directed RNA polymerase subunit RPC12/RpoP
MECPHCHKEILGKPCPACGAHVPDDSRYCMDCGASLAEKPQEEVEQEESPELDDRILCPDGNCTGIIVDGRCSECGHPYAEPHTEK